MNGLSGASKKDALYDALLESIEITFNVDSAAANFYNLKFTEGEIQTMRHSCLEFVRRFGNVGIIQEGRNEPIDGTTRERGIFWILTIQRVIRVVIQWVDWDNDRVSQAEKVPALAEFVRYARLSCEQDRAIRQGGRYGNH